MQNAQSNLPLLYQKGLAVLKEVAGSKQAEALSLEKAHQLSADYNKTEVEDISEILVSASSYLVLPDWLPRSEVLTDGYLESKSFFLSRKVEDFLNDIEDDPHLKLDLAILRQAVKETGFDPNQNLTTSVYKPKHLILLGTGCGKTVRELLRVFDPAYLTIIVNDWHEWASSFFAIDWLEIWNQYCLSPDRSICALQTTDTNALQSYLVNNLLPVLDHSFIYIPPGASSDLNELRESFKSGMIERAVNYLGFVMDEYNMIYNSWKSLSLNPRIYRPPQISKRSGTYLVCGSGPSLDQSLKEIKLLQDTCTIIACGSNYGTLRQAGVDVDILCLLERGDFMVQQYKDVCSKYGPGKTKLFASVTTPSELHELFSDTMVYFRPALTPLSLFAESPEQILVNEGPQTINTGVSFALAMGARNIILYGVDLGVRSQDNVRSSHAIGDSPRIFNKQDDANYGGIVFTNDMLIDAKIVLENLASSLKGTTVGFYNRSDGIKIHGWIPLLQHEVESTTCQGFADSLDDYSPIRGDNSGDILTEWWKTCVHYESRRFRAMWIASRPRQFVQSTCSYILSLLRSDEPLYPNLMMKIHHALKISDGTRASQVAPRIIRGQVLKLLLAIHRQQIIMASDSEKAREFEQKAKSILANRVDAMRAEIFQLFDLLERQTS